MANVLQTKVDAQCDKLATKLNWQCLRRSTFSSHSEYSSKVANFNPPNLHLAPPLGVTPFEFCRDFRHQKTRTSRVIVWHCLRDPMFSRFSRTPTCDRWTDGQTDRHTTTAHAELAWRRAVKTGNIITRDVYRGSKYTLRHYKITLLNSTVSTYHICYHATKTSRDKTRKCVHHCKYISNDQPLSPLLTFQIFVDCRSMYKFIYKKIYSYI